jgi:ribonucleoside-diphosphate reductase alpha chain
MSVPRRQLPETRDSVTRKFKLKNQEPGRSDLRVYVTVGLYPDGKPGEVFIKADKVGTLVSGSLDALAITMSLALQYGVPLEAIVNKFTNMRFEPSGPTGDPVRPIATSILDYIARWMADRFLKATAAPEAATPQPELPPAAPSPEPPALPPQPDRAHEGKRAERAENGGAKRPERRKK